MPQQYVMASAPSAHSLHLDMEIETTDTQQTCRVMALLDSRATGLFLDLEFIKHYGLTMQPLPKPIPVYNIDGTPNKAVLLDLWSTWFSAIGIMRSMPYLPSPAWEGKT
ncbi:hypothetical protein J132_08241 [Termitomyces sp. J132]|nr:hypothetical protein J132_08241 [Termitomyces sp. J132]